MNINSANAPTPDATQAVVTGTSKAATSHSKSAVNQNTFMTLLVAQLKNQDPLAPQEGAEFVAQLAQFNSLEQLININDRLSQLVNQQKAEQTPTGRKPNL